MAMTILNRYKEQDNRNYLKTSLNLAYGNVDLLTGEEEGDSKAFCDRCGYVDCVCVLERLP
ncbi:MAG: hypothetical protein HQL27_09920 [Candidatus Omnitrophica bacterium]|nr:hypothetical protein [Candidatus Omnitrophota bacterium]